MRLRKERRSIEIPILSVPIKDSTSPSKATCWKGRNFAPDAGLIAKVLATSEQRRQCASKEHLEGTQASRIRRSSVSISQRTNAGPMVPTSKLFYGDRISTGSGSIPELVAKFGPLPAESFTPHCPVSESGLTPVIVHLNQALPTDGPGLRSTSIFGGASR